ncbi:glycosyltransferase family 9 protein [Vibrio sp. SM6]|uniref:Glycosyltransferase family 9 protein n=1 Tax=Vibrio agarilyticus TaxID=2726741 RepID=A0A7X8TMK8_9VIBR|nr:glycosyltransferase family 9 protein [Vibrio agarilyticus]NLS11532.1 glycosyltransferase family 9 protein [Vibrio agarilyticus]
MRVLKNHLRQFDKYRKAKMCRLEGVLHRLIRHKSYCEPNILSKDQVERILIVRNNKRIGNMLFLLPFLRQVRDVFPDAHLTLMLRDESQAELFANLGVDEFCFSRLSFRNIFKTLRLVRDLRQQPFDVIFAPNDSAEDAALTALIPARNKISRDTLNRNEAYTHVFPYQGEKKHAALASLYLLPAAGFPLAPIDHSIEFCAKEKAFGEQEVDKIQSDQTENALLIAYFRGARGAKLLPDSYWDSLLDRFEQKVDKPIQWVEVLSPDIPEPLRSDIDTFSSPNLRLLASYLTQVDAFICCDTGPLHLADSANVKCIGLYNRTCTTTFGLLSDPSVCVKNIETFDVKQTLQQVGALA